jgi:4-hydroxythreonine-4-phosphate dehydrogenase
VAVLLDRGPVVLALALPGLGRTTVGGVVVQDGVPLHQTDLWHGEPRPAPHSIVEAVAPLPAEIMGTALLRGAPQEYERLLAMLGNRGVVPICDAETEDDLERIARAAVSVGAQPVGSSAFGRAVAKVLLREQEESPTSPSIDDHAGVRRADERGCNSRSHNPVLVVVGTMSSQGRAQLDLLAGSGVPVFAIPPDKLLNGVADPSPVRTALRAGPVAVTVGSNRVTGVDPAALATALASFAGPLAQGVPLVLTGGATARAVLDWLGVRRLSTLGEIEQGAVLSRTDTGALVVTRPGAFGGVESLRLILDRLAQFERGAARVPHSEVAP